MLEQYRKSTILQGKVMIIQSYFCVDGVRSTVPGKLYNSNVGGCMKPSCRVAVFSGA